MLRIKSNNLFSKHISITTILGVVVMLVLSSSCGGNRTGVGDAITERDSLPILTTYGVNSLISDSGITRYRIIAEEWLVYDKKRPSYWAFEKGAYLEQFDSIFNVDASVKADTAYYFDKEKLWKLIGNVEIHNLRDQSFYTELLYWNEATQKVYTDEFVRMVEPERTIMGYGFESDQQFNAPRIFKMSGEFDIEEEQTVSGPPSDESSRDNTALPTDTIN